MGKQRNYGDHPGQTIQCWAREQKAALRKKTMDSFLHKLSKATGSLPSVNAGGTADWLEQLAKALANSFRSGPARERLGFLAYNGKVEGTVRDEVVWQLAQAKGHPFGMNQCWFGREYLRVDGVMGTGQGEAHAAAAFQAKQIYVADIFDSRNELLQHLNLDVRLKAPWNLRNQSPSVQVGLLLVLDRGAATLPDLPTCGYSDLLKEQLKNGWSESAWMQALQARLAALSLAAGVSGRWDLQEPRQAEQPFALHWFLVTPSPRDQSLD